jgi:hypothetical protein
MPESKSPPHTPCPHHPLQHSHDLLQDMPSTLQAPASAPQIPPPHVALQHSQVVLQLWPFGLQPPPSGMQTPALQIPLQHCHDPWHSPNCLQLPAS